MIFNSLTFVVFFAVFICGWTLLKKFRIWRLVYILTASAVFYGWWDWRFLFLIFYVGTVDYFLAMAMSACRNKSLKKLILGITILNAVCTLSIFKYSLFFAGIVNNIFGFFGVSVHLERFIPEFCLILPVGISFFTFQSMSYTIDVYRNELKATKSYLLYMSYLMLFPQLVAGPIVRARDLLYRLDAPPIESSSMKYNGLKLVVLGFFKKCFLADNIALFVNAAFASVTQVGNSLEWWCVMALFGIQIYCDFSGYSDIARGIIKIMGYRFNLNFNHPYFAVSVKDFWNRWHISLSSWFRDYVYIPLGGSKSSKHSKLIGVKNLWVTFLLSGLWHGASWNFVIWGGAHALFLTVERVTGYAKKLRMNRSTTLLCWLIIQLQVLIAWVFFRAQTLQEALFILHKMFDFSADKFNMSKNFILYIAVFFVMELLLLCNIDHILFRLFRKKRRYIEPILLAILLVITIFFRGGSHGFIYFQF